MATSHKKTKAILNKHWKSIVADKASGMSIKDISMSYGVSRQTLEARFKKQVVTNTPANPSLRILVLDIENAPMMSYHWGLWAQDIHQGMRIPDTRSYMMCVAAKWLGEDEVFYYETRTEDDSLISAQILKLVDEADIIIGHNAKRFDMKKINAYAILNGLTPPSPYRVIDTMSIAKKEFSFERNTLEYLSNALCTSTKSSHKKFNGFELWSECMKGNEEAWDEMKRYNIQDILVTEELYLKLRPWSKGHPNITTGSMSESKRCPTCGSLDLQPSGYSTTNTSQFKRYKCDNCGSYSRGRSNILTTPVKANLLVSCSNG